MIATSEQFDLGVAGGRERPAVALLDLQQCFVDRFAVPAESGAGRRGEHDGATGGRRSLLRSAESARAIATGDRRALSPLPNFFNASSAQAAFSTA
jgi:hypothetical protein